MNPVETLYRAMTTDTLRALRHAFEHDRAYAEDQRNPAETLALCDHRLRLIDQLLREREA